MNLYEKIKQESNNIAWNDLTGSDQEAVEHFLSYNKLPLRNKDELIDAIRHSCHTIGEANEELIDTGYWKDDIHGPEIESEPDEQRVYNYLVSKEGLSKLISQDVNNKE